MVKLYRRHQFCYGRFKTIDLPYLSFLAYIRRRHLGFVERGRRRSAEKYKMELLNFVPFSTRHADIGAKNDEYRTQISDSYDFIALEKNDEGY